MVEWKVLRRDLACTTNTKRKIPIGVFIRNATWYTLTIKNPILNSLWSLKSTKLKNRTP